MVAERTDTGTVTDTGTDIGTDTGTSTNISIDAGSAWGNFFNYVVSYNYTENSKCLCWSVQTY